MGPIDYLVRALVPTVLSAERCGHKLAYSHEKLTQAFHVVPAIWVLQQEAPSQS